MFFTDLEQNKNFQGLQNNIFLLIWIQWFILSTSNFLISKFNPFIQKKNKLFNKNKDESNSFANDKILIEEPISNLYFITS